ncbi:MAG: 16S/23S rRNA (cytidine-2'-O)-methyltransferase TlyA [Syntrophaceae bacterium PtaB.Bin038]|nr:MAG: 16S/23S rRNA (cytidine-2'-O)-methyltransferase TlyA [Syntrophaceae bacterium PtaB.Bin038]
MREKSPKKRLDVLLVDRGLVASRERARALILAGAVLVNEQPVVKAGALVSGDADVRVRGGDHPYVSRGGVKLKGALDAFGIRVEGLTALDVGASTGGFTDCLLQEGARKVYAVDVGYGQIAWKLRNDPRVVLFERTNIRHFAGVGVEEPVDLATIDTSFISLRHVVPATLRFVRPGGGIVALVKPQFEAGRGEVGKKGVVRDPAVHARVVEDLAAFFGELGLTVRATCESPLTGPEGNREFFIYAVKKEGS